MKQFLILTCLFLITMAVSAQGNKERIKAYKTAYLTDQLDLTAAEAEKFWPVYNAYDDTVFELKVKKMRRLHKAVESKGGLDKLTEAEAADFLKQYSEIEEKTLAAKKTLHSKLKDIISAKKILKLERAEIGFNKFLLERMRKGRENRNR